MTKCKCNTDLDRFVNNISDKFFEDFCVHRTSLYIYIYINISAVKQLITIILKVPINGELY